MRYAMNKVQLGTEVLAQNYVTWFCVTPFIVLLEKLQNEELDMMLYLSCIRL